MELQFSLLATVAAIMAWVIRTQNGGLLNVLFRNVSSPTGHELEFDLITEVDAPVVEFFKRMLLSQPLPLPILQVMPESLGGGQAAVDSARANPNRGPKIFWITFSIFLLSVVLIILIQVINCCCCCYRKKDPHGSMNALQTAVLRSNFTNKQLILRIAYIVALILALVFLTVSIILLIMYFSSTGLVVSYLETTPKPSVDNQTHVSLPYGLHAAISHASSFVNKGITKARTLTNATLHDFVDRTYAKLLKEVTDTIERLLDYLGAQNALQKGEKLIKVTKSLSTHVFDAYGNVTRIHNEIVLLEAKLTSLRTVYARALGSIRACENWDLCKGLKAIVANIKSPILSTKLNANLLKPYIERLNQTIEDLPGPLNEVRGSITKLHKSTKDVLDSLKSELNLPQTLKQIEPFWDGAQSHADTLLKQLSKTVDSVKTQLPKYVPRIRVGFFILGGVFMVMLIIATLIAMRLVYRAIHDRLFAHPNTISIGSRRRKWDEVVCGKGAVCCCSALFIPLLLIFAAIIAVLLFVLTTISSEGCIYLERESAVRMSDFVVNGYVARHWKLLISDAVGGSADFLNKSPPKNILLALTQNCSRGASQHPVGLLSALGYHSLVNVPKLVNSREVTDAIQQGKEAVMKQVKGLNIARSLPSTKELEEVRDTLREAIRNFMLTDLLEDTNPAKMNTALFEEILRGMGLFYGYGNITNAAFTQPNKDLAQAIASMRKIKSGLEKTHKSLQQLDSRKASILGPLSELIDALKASRHAAEQTELTKEVGKEYDNLAANLTDYLKVDGEKTFMKLTASLFPCEEAHAAYSAAIGFTCGEAGGVRLLLGLSYVLALNVLFITFVYLALFILAFFQALQIRMLSDLAESDDDGPISKYRRDFFLK